MRVLVAHPGTQYSHKLVLQLDRLNLLHSFCTGFVITRDSLLFRLLRLLPSALRRKLSNRVLSAIEPSKVKTFIWLELKALLQLSLGGEQEQVFFERNRRFQEQIPDSLLASVDAVIGFDTSSWILAARCRELGTRFYLDVSIGHPSVKESIYKDLFQKYPQWKEQLRPKSLKLIDVEESEMRIASKIVVPSHFVKETYVANGISADLIHVNPFGTFLAEFASRPKPLLDNINFLFFGALSARKGLPLLLEVWRYLRPTNATLILAGYGSIPKDLQLPPRVVNVGAIDQSRRVDLYNNAHVFVFPSNFEGLAQVQIEAMACGLPIISTFNAGGSELIQEGKNGFIIRHDNFDELMKAIQFFISNTHSIEKMGSESLAMSTLFSLDIYGERWKRILSFH